jgi:D-lactate dehydrogenase
MKVVAYSVKPFEKVSLVKANQKKHDITLISNSLSMETIAFAKEKDAVIISSDDNVSAAIINGLANLGVKYITTRSVITDHIDKDAAAYRGIKLANVPSYTIHPIAEHAVALALALNRKLVKAFNRVENFDFRNEELIGFNLYGKTVGIIGMSNIGLLVSGIYKAFGCQVLGYDADLGIGHDHIPLVSLNELLSKSDIISLHAPLTESTHGIINEDTIKLMKHGVMVINTASTALIRATDILCALENNKIGYLGLALYGYEKDMLFDDQKNDQQKDQLLKRLINHPSALITAHQSYLTDEELETVALQTVQNLDLWQEEKCLEGACACKNNCFFKNQGQQKTSPEDNLNILP